MASFTVSTEDPIALSLVGSVLAENFELQRLIGYENANPLYSAADYSTHRSCTVCVCLGDVNDDSLSYESTQANFVRATSAMSQISRTSSSVVKVEPITQYTELPDGRQTPFAVLEPLIGTSLANLLQPQRGAPQRPLSFEHTFDMLEECMITLTHAHDQGIVHRNISPRNLWVCGDKIQADAQIKLMGFSGAPRTVYARDEIANVLRRDIDPLYAAPESAQGNESRIGAWSDVYSFAKIMLTLMGMNSSLRGVPKLDPSIQDPRQSYITPQSHGLYGYQALLFQSALAENDRERFRGMSEFLQAIDEAIETRTTQWTKRSYSSSAATSGEIEVEFAANELPLPEYLRDGEDGDYPESERDVSQTMPESLLEETAHLQGGSPAANEAPSANEAFSGRQRRKHA